MRYRAPYGPNKLDWDWDPLVHFGFGELHCELKYEILMELKSSTVFATSVIPSGSMDS